MAYGDFPQDRHDWTTGLFCRNENSDIEFQPFDDVKSVGGDDDLSDRDFEEGVERDSTGRARRSFHRMDWKDEGLWDKIEVLDPTK